MPIEKHPVLQVLPRVPSAACGVGDYAWRLAGQMRLNHGIESAFLATNHGDINAPAAAGFPVIKLPRPARSDLLQQTDSTHGSAAALLLHYSPYGYQKRGVPFWLVSAWEKLAARRQRPRLVTMFHEVAASGPLTTSAFWLRPFQRLLARRLVHASDACLTNCSANLEELRAACGDKLESVSIVPVFSNFGEPESLPAVAQRARELVLFTSNLNAQHGEACLWETMAQTVIDWRLERLVLIGRPAEVPPGFPCPVTQTGFLSPLEASRQLLRCAFGYAFVGPSLFGKSGIFAALAAHGVIPLVPTPAPVLPDGLEAGMHYLRASMPEDLGDLEKLQSHLLAWYRAHDLAATTRMFAQALAGPPGAQS